MLGDEVMLNLEKIQYVVLDLDNTLIQHDNSIETEHLCGELGIPLDKELENQIKKFWLAHGEFTDNVQMTKEKYYGMIQDNIPRLGELNINGEAILDAMFARPPLALYDGATELLQAVKKRGKKIIALSDWFKEDQIKNLKFLDIYNFFDDVYGWDNSYAKPSKLALEKVIKGLEKESFIMIGDGLKTDVQCANNVGIASIWINEHKQSPGNIIPSITVSSVKEVAELFKN